MHLPLMLQIMVVVADMQAGVGVVAATAGGVMRKATNTSSTMVARGAEGEEEAEAVADSHKTDQMRALGCHAG